MLVENTESKAPSEMWGVGWGGVGEYRRWLSFQPDYKGAVLMEVIHLERGAHFRTAIYL